MVLNEILPNFGEEATLREKLQKLQFCDLAGEFNVRNWEYCEVTGD